MNWGEVTGELGGRSLVNWGEVTGDHPAASHSRTWPNPLGTQSP